MSEPIQPPGQNEAHDAGDGGPDHDHPLGTPFLLMIFLMVLAGMWGALYLTLLSR